MPIFALADPHLSFATPHKNMDVFGPLWEKHAEKIAKHWRSLVSTEDLVLIPGDISWAMHLEDALVDLRWIDDLPGTKVILKGNHDLWWPSSSRLKEKLPPSIHFIHNTSFDWQNVTIGGSRLWDTEEYSFHPYIHFQDNPVIKKELTFAEKEVKRQQDKKIFAREVERLKLSLQQLNPRAEIRIALTHYPPISADLKPSSVSAIFEEFQIHISVFGHLHSLDKQKSMFGEIKGTRYICASCDYLDFVPVRIL